MKDMNPGDIVGDYREASLKYHDGSERRVYVTEIETAVADGQLIVSRTDPAGIITDVNQSFVAMSGYEECELIGMPHYILRHPDMPATAFKGLWETVQQNKKWHGYVKNLRKDGGFYWVYATVITNVRQGQVVGYTSVRRKPSRTRVSEAEECYQNMK